MSRVIMMCSSRNCFKNPDITWREVRTHASARLEIFPTPSSIVKVEWSLLQPLEGTPGFVVDHSDRKVLRVLGVPGGALTIPSIRSTPIGSLQDGREHDSYSIFKIFPSKFTWEPWDSRRAANMRPLLRPVSNVQRLFSWQHICFMTVYVQLSAFR